MDTMCFTVQGKNGEKPLELNYERVFAIGYAGRNIEKTMEHIKELERELGVPAPKKIPTIFQCGNYVLTQEKKLEFVGEKTCGEVEYVIVIRRFTSDWEATTQTGSLRQPVFQKRNRFVRSRFAIPFGSTRMSRITGMR